MNRDTSTGNVDDRQERSILLRPGEWIPQQLGGVLPATRDAVKKITTLPRERLTLIALMAVAMVAAVAVFTLLFVRRR